MPLSVEAPSASANRSSTARACWIVRQPPADQERDRARPDSGGSGGDALVGGGDATVGVAAVDRGERVDGRRGCAGSASVGAACSACCSRTASSFSTIPISSPAGTRSQWAVSR